VTQVATIHGPALSPARDEEPLKTLEVREVDLPLAGKTMSALEHCRTRLQVETPVKSEGTKIWQSSQ
jgi:hypothetical protein